MNWTRILRVVGLVAILVAVVLLLDLTWVRAHLGGADSQLKLAYANAMGQGIDKDEESATHWYRRAAEQGDPRGQLALAIRYEQGVGVDADAEAASDWYRRAVASGSAEAALALSQRHYQGKGVPQDNVRSAMWLIIADRYAAARADGLELLEVLKEELSGTELAEARRIAQDWRAANPVTVGPVLSPQDAAALGADSIPES
ncbi:sel1 repeat family protein [Myxococcota bacterium]|nr:sel1 repeat family protein [Myxococcota bacterium]